MIAFMYREFLLLDTKQGSRFESITSYWHSLQTQILAIAGRIAALCAQHNVALYCVVTSNEASRTLLLHNTPSL